MFCSRTGAGASTWLDSPVAEGCRSYALAVLGALVAAGRIREVDA
jgi:hypothetical protein